MTEQYILSSKAGSDLDEILDYSIEQFGEETARSYLKSMKQCFHMLTRFPLCGRKVDYIKSNTRRHPHDSHVIYCRIRKQDIFILRILHQSMHIKRHLR